VIWRLLFVVVLLASVADVTTASTRGASSEAEFYMRKYARCMMSGYHKDAVALVTSTVDSSDFYKRFPSLVMRDAVGFLPRCQPVVELPPTGKFNFDGDPLRFALAEALVEREWAAQAPTDFAAVPLLPSFKVQTRAAFDAAMASLSSVQRRADVQAAYDRSVATAWVMQFGECVARRDPVHARAWILSPLDSKAETTEIQSLSASFGECLREGEKLTFNKPLLRGAVAVSYVRLAEAHQSLQAKGAR
jgi:hypothetical protein